VSKTALLGAIPPFLLQTDDNPKGVEVDAAFLDVLAR
jgi:hypothetical protein